MPQHRKREGQKALDEILKEEVKIIANYLYNDSLSDIPYETALEESELIVDEVERRIHKVEEEYSLG